MLVHRMTDTDAVTCLCRNSMFRTADDTSENFQRKNLIKFQVSNVQGSPCDD